MCHLLLRRIASTKHTQFVFGALETLGREVPTLPASGKYPVATNIRHRFGLSSILVAPSHCLDPRQYQAHEYVTSCGDSLGPNSSDHRKTIVCPAVPLTLTSLELTAPGRGKCLHMPCAEHVRTPYQVCNIGYKSRIRE